MRIQSKKLLFLLITVFISSLKAVDNGHFYKAANLHKTPTTGWFDKEMKYDNLDWLSKLDFTYGYGDAGTAWDNDRHTTALLNSTGNHKMIYLMENVVVKPSEQDFATFLANAQINHWTTNCKFGELKFDGDFKIHDFNINFRQNFVKDFFAEILVPIRKVELRNICYKDLSPCTGRFSQQTGEWRQFLNQFNTILANYCYKPYNTEYSKTDFGDISFNLGWQGIKEYEEGDGDINFLSLLAKVGVLFPTGAPREVDYVFSIPTGYGDHWGINLAAQFEFSVKKIINISMHGSATLFFDKSDVWRRVKTFELQQGFIKLTKVKVTEDKGALWHLGADLKFDHIAGGLSLLVGYSFNARENDKLYPNDNMKYAGGIINTDTELNGWEMQILHCMADYDFSVHCKKNAKFAPRINFFYNWPFKGKSAFKTDMIGGGLGIDVRWEI